MLNRLHPDLQPDSRVFLDSLFHLQQEDRGEGSNPPDANPVRLIDDVKEHAACELRGEIGQRSDGTPQRLPVADEVAAGHCCVTGRRMVVHQHIEALHSDRHCRCHWHRGQARLSNEEAWLAENHLDQFLLDSS